MIRINFKRIFIIIMAGLLLNGINPHFTRVLAFNLKKITSDEKLNTRIYKKTAPAVVKITTSNLFFNFSNNPMPNEPSGSGVIIDTDGYILTNRHVIENAGNLNVILADHSSYPAKIIGSDIDNDLAIIKINPPKEKKLCFLTVGDSSNLETGQKVIAIGDPFGFEGTMTTGIISNTNRELKLKNGKVIKNIIQTDAAINPGNSGGPLIDTKGQLIGINTAIFSPYQACAGISFAIPASIIKRVVPDLIKYGFVQKPYLGILSAIPVNGYYSSLLKVPPEGLLILEIMPQSPADKAGLYAEGRIMKVNKQKISAAGDIILSVDGNKFKDFAELTSYVESKKAGDVLNFSIFKDNIIKNVNIKLVQ